MFSTELANCHNSSSGFNLFIARVKTWSVYGDSKSFDEIIRYYNWNKNFPIANCYVVQVVLNFKFANEMLK